MRIIDQFRFTGTAVKSRKLRTGLTMLGIIIGIAAIVALVGLGNGFENTVSGQLSTGLSTRILTVSSRKGFGAPPDAGDFQLNVSDGEVIASLSPENITAVAPIIQQQCNVSTGETGYNTQASGIDFGNYSLLFPTLFLAANSSIPTIPTNNSFVVGSKIAQPTTDGPIYFTVGDNLTIYFRNSTFGALVTYTAPISAILSEIGGVSSVTAPSDSGIYLQIGIAGQIFNTTQVNTILVYLASDSKETIFYVINAIQTHYNNQVSVMSPTSIVNTLSSTFSTIELFIVAIASIALLVAGIGIMNIQIVSVLERTREGFASFRKLKFFQFLRKFAPLIALQ